MPSPEKLIWVGHFKSGTVQFQPETEEHPASIIFLIQLDEPVKQSSVPIRGRIVEVRFTHELLAAALVNDIVQAMREKGQFLPETMG